MKFLSEDNEILSKDNEIGEVIGSTSHLTLLQNFSSIWKECWTRENKSDFYLSLLASNDHQLLHL